MLSIIYPVFLNGENHAFLSRMFERYGKMSSNVLEQTCFVLIDDHSVTPIEFPKKMNLNLSVYRILDDIPWNQGGARNLGVVLAPTKKLIVTDIDHYIPEETLRWCLDNPVDKPVMYNFQRKKGGKKINPHRNTYLIDRNLFLKYNGVDEEFCGNYGHEDTYFRKYLKKKGVKVKKSRLFIEYVDECYYPENYHDLPRDPSVNRALWKDKKEHSRKILNFRWEMVQEFTFKG